MTPERLEEIRSILDGTPDWMRKGDRGVACDLLAEIDAAWKHDCNRWRLEGIGCAECNPVATAIRDCWDDPIRAERDRFKAQVATLRCLLFRLANTPQGDAQPLQEWRACVDEVQRVLAETAPREAA